MCICLCSINYIYTLTTNIGNGEKSKTNCTKVVKNVSITIAHVFQIILNVIYFELYIFLRIPDLNGENYYNIEFWLFSDTTNLVKCLYDENN